MDKNNAEDVVNSSIQDEPSESDTSEVSEDKVEIQQIPAPSKPKRVLTEAQRLAFLKGREKRLANIEKRRQEKIEEVQQSIKEDIPPKPILKRQTNKQEIDYDAIADRILQRLSDRNAVSDTEEEEEPKPRQKRKYTKRPATRSLTPSPERYPGRYQRHVIPEYKQPRQQQQQTVEFSWM